MLDWGQGYHIDIPYTVGFYPDLAPIHIEFGAALFRLQSRSYEAGCELL